MLSYDAASLSQLGVFNTSPDYGLTSIWQSGNGLAADEGGNIFASTAETGRNGFDVPSGGQTYCMTALKLAPDLPVDPVDYFTPWNVAFLNSHDMDLSSSGPMVLPDQNGPWPHELVVTGKYGVAFVLNRDNLGMYSPGDSNALQEVVLVPNSDSNPLDVMMSSPAYWNNTVYFAPNGSPLLAFPLSAGLLGAPLKTPAKYSGAHSPSISSNGNANGILWVMGNGQLLAFDAVSLNMLYGTVQAPNKRDALPALGHFATQTVANGRVYVGTQTSLEAYALFPAATVTGGNAQTATVATVLPLPLQVQVTNPYAGQPDVGITVNFSDGGKGGSFNPPSAITDANGNVSTLYTLPKKAATYTLTISGTNLGTATATATATPGPVIKIVALGGEQPDRRRRLHSCQAYRRPSPGLLQERDLRCHRQLYRQPRRRPQSGFCRHRRHGRGSYDSAVAHHRHQDYGHRQFDRFAKPLLRRVLGCRTRLEHRRHRRQ